MHIIHNVSSIFKDNHLVRSLMPIAHPAPPSRPHTPAHIEPEAQKYDQGGGVALTMRISIANRNQTKLLMYPALVK